MRPKLRFKQRPANGLLTHSFVVESPDVGIDFMHVGGR